MTDYTAGGGHHHATQRLYSNRATHYDPYNNRGPHHGIQDELMLTQMRSFRLTSPKSNLLNTGNNDGNSNKVTLCDHELD